MNATRRDWMVPVAAAFLLALHAVLALWAVSGKGVTHDELLHVTGGYFYDKHGDFRLHPENGVLPQRLHGLAAVWTGAPRPMLALNHAWATSDANVIGHRFFYETGHDHRPMLMGARALNVVFSLATGVLIFAWARRLGGDAAGLLTLVLFALDPNMLAHGPLATSDAAAVFFLLASSGAFWAHLRDPGWRNGALSALTFGLACVAKYSAVLLLPVFLVLLAWRIALDPAKARWWKLAPATLAAHGAAALVVIWACFNFRYSGFAPDLPPADHYIVPWEGVLPFIGIHGKVVQFCRDWQLLPEAFLYGYSWVVQSAQARAAFLAGEYSIHGWVSFFPLAFWWKTPVALLAGIALGAFALGRRWREPGQWRRDLPVAAPLLVLFTIYWAFSLTSNLNIGHRHILPTYPVLFILVGQLAASGVLRELVGRTVPWLLAGGTLLANLWVAPHYLAFFNVLAGGPANGWRLLVDSSLDWGQDLPALAQWLREHRRPDEQVFLSYFGTDEPRYHGIDAVRLPFVNGFKQAPVWYEPRAGLYAVNATMLQQVYAPVRGPWTEAHEKEYQELRAAEPAMRVFLTDKTAREQIRGGLPDSQWEKAWVRFDRLRFARLCHYLRARQPDHVLAHTFFLYRLTQEELDVAINRSFSEWRAAVARGGPP